jgi:hypothetical protein
MILLDATNETLEMLTGAAVSADYTVTYADIGPAAFTPGAAEGNVAAATTTTIVGAPASSVQRQIKLVTIRNRSATAAQVVTLKKDVAGTEYLLTPDVTLRPGEQLVYADGAGFTVLDRSGRVKTIAADSTGVGGRCLAFYKASGSSEGAGMWFFWGMTSGFPGAWAPGTPGLAGRATDGTTSADNGCLKVPNAAAGANYITELSATASVICHMMLMDVLWVNSGIVVTQTTAQTINSVTLPARDANGATAGEGVQVGLFTSVATTNAGAISGATISYTNQDGTSGRTAIVGTGTDAIPATMGTFCLVPFQLQAGDTGVRSIQSITLGTSLVTGTVHLAMFRLLKSVPVIAANIGSSQSPQNPGIRLYDGACLLLTSIASSASPNIIAGTVAVMER